MLAELTLSTLLRLPPERRYMAFIWVIPGIGLIALGWIIYEIIQVYKGK